ncbi:hypothetical protein LUZ60_005923 [Juncus effusus]|nr:hypothetical protein LUZ60_005923 [Juncus effusus]
MDPSTSTKTGHTKKPLSKPTYCCFFCALKEPDTNIRRISLTEFFSDMPDHDNESNVLVSSSIWSIAMVAPTDMDLPSFGVLNCMARLISKALSNPSWMNLDQNKYIPYYAAHIIGSYTIRVPSLATLAVQSGVVGPLVRLMEGKISWVEQRVAVRALGHLTSYDSTFPYIAPYSKQLIPLAMSIASSCIDMVYEKFIRAKPGKREKYHRDLLTRGLGGVEMEDRKAEEWASQIQCWSLYLLSCFASKDSNSHVLMVENVGFLKELSQMWGGLVNGDSPAGVGLMRLLCRSRIGREGIARYEELVRSLCHLSRSCDDWQYMGIDCLLLLLDDSKTSHRVVEIASPHLVDLAELGNLGERKNLGDAITKALLKDYHGHLLNNESGRAMKSLWELKVERKNREEVLSNVEKTNRVKLATLKKQEGKERYISGNIEGAIVSYTQALGICPLTKRQVRMIIYSNLSQCWLLLNDPDKAISDATRALTLANPTNYHAKSLWRRAQAYDMKGMAKESLMDCLMYVNGWFGPKKKGKGEGMFSSYKVKYYVVRMINKQMNVASLFAHGKMVCRKEEEEVVVMEDDDVEEEEEEGQGMKSSVSGLHLPTIVEELRFVRRQTK